MYDELLINLTYFLRFKKNLILSECSRQKFSADVYYHTMNGMLTTCLNTHFTHILVMTLNNKKKGSGGEEVKILRTLTLFSHLSPKKPHTTYRLARSIACLPLWAQPSSWRLHEYTIYFIFDEKAKTWLLD